MQFPVLHSDGAPTTAAAAAARPTTSEQVMSGVARVHLYSGTIVATNFLPTMLAGAECFDNKGLAIHWRWLDLIFLFARFCLSQLTGLK